jgi:hypothetical protein
MILKTFLEEKRERILILGVINKNYLHILVLPFMLLKLLFPALKLGFPGLFSLVWRHTGNELVFKEGHCITDVFTIAGDRNITIVFPPDPYADRCSLHTTYFNVCPFFAARQSRLNPDSLHLLGRHSTAASSLCPQLLWLHGLAGHSHKEDSSPVQFTSLSHMGPVP